MPSDPIIVDPDSSSSDDEPVIDDEDLDTGDEDSDNPSCPNKLISVFEAGCKSLVNSSSRLKDWAELATDRLSEIINKLKNLDGRLKKINEQMYGSDDSDDDSKDDTQGSKRDIYNGTKNSYEWRIDDLEDRITIDELRNNTESDSSQDRCIKYNLKVYENAERWEEAVIKKLSKKLWGSFKKKHTLEKKVAVMEKKAEKTKTLLDDSKSDISSCESTMHSIDEKNTYNWDDVDGFEKQIKNYEIRIGLLYQRVLDYEAYLASLPNGGDDSGSDDDESSGPLIEDPEESSSDFPSNIITDPEESGSDIPSGIITDPEEGG